MKPDRPILTITLQVPLVEGIGPEEILEFIGYQVAEALEQMRSGQAPASDEDEAEVETPEDPTEKAERLAWKETVVRETLEPYTDPTKTDILASLGYMPRNGG